MFVVDVCIVLVVAGLLLSLLLLFGLVACVVDVVSC